MNVNETPVAAPGVAGPDPERSGGLLLAVDARPHQAMIPVALGLWPAGEAARVPTRLAGRAAGTGIPTTRSYHLRQPSRRYCHALDSLKKGRPGLPSFPLYLLHKGCLCRGDIGWVGGLSGPAVRQLGRFVGRAGSGFHHLDSVVGSSPAIIFARGPPRPHGI